MLIETLIAFALVGAVPPPDNPDGSRGTPVWEYEYKTLSTNGRHMMRCRVPVNEPRYCWYAGAGVR